MLKFILADNPASPFGPMIKIKDKSGKVLVIVSAATLEATNLAGQMLRHADLTSARLARADLSKADLTGADLTSADLTDANLQKADLSRCKLESGTP